MSAIDDIEAAIARQRQENAQAVQAHRADSKALADMTQKLEAAINGQITDVDVARLVAEINEAAQELHAGITDTHTAAVGAKPAAATTSDVQGGSTQGPDVVSASSPGVIKPEATSDASSQAVPDSLGGGAMPAREPTIGEKAPGSPAGTGEPSTEEKPAEPQPPKDEKANVASPAVPSVKDVPSNVHDNAPNSAKKA